MPFKELTADVNKLPTEDLRAGSKRGQAV